MAADSQPKPDLVRQESSLQSHHPTLTRGRITQVATGTSRGLMFNPANVSDDKKINWGTTEVPGASHPVYAFGSGGERLVSFEVYLDGDRGRFGRQQARDQNLGLSVIDEMMWFRSLVYPRQYGMDVTAVFPYTILFTMGPLYQNMPCICKAAPWNVEFWTPKMDPVRCRIQLQLAELVDKSVTADKILALGGFTVGGQ